MRTLLLLLALLLPAPVTAQSVDLGKYGAAQTRFGTLTAQELPNGYESVLTLQETGATILTDRYVSIRGAFARQGENFDWVVVEHAHGGNMCPVVFTLLKVSPAGVQRSPDFGSCLGPVLDVRLLPGKIEMAMGDPDLRTDRHVYRFDGAAFDEDVIDAGSDAAAPSGAGGDVNRWLGQHSSALFSDAGERARLLQLMSLDQLESLRVGMAVGENSTQRGDWVIGRGCMAHQCNVVAGFWARRISDGQTVAGLFNRDSGEQLWGAPEALADPVVAAFIGEMQWY